MTLQTLPKDKIPSLTVVSRKKISSGLLLTNVETPFQTVLSLLAAVSLSCGVKNMSFCLQLTWLEKLLMFL